MLGLIEQRKHFVLHAPRQTGKTTCLMALAKHLNESGTFRAVCANVEVGQSARENVARAMRSMLAGIGEQARDDVQYVRDIGLISANGEMRISNGIYREVIPRELT